MPKNRAILITMFHILLTDMLFKRISIFEIIQRSVSQLHYLVNQQRVKLF